MIILGIESTAHTFGIGIIKASQNACQILTNCKDSYSSSDIGMIPGDIAIHHKKVATDVLKRALSEAKLSWEQIDSIAYSAGPGLDPALWAGFNFAKDLANKQNKQLIPVNHCTAHLSIGKIINHAKDPVYLYVSGVNTQVIVQQGVKNKNKQGKYTPGKHILIKPSNEGIPKDIDYAFLGAWNFKNEIIKKEKEFIKKGGKFITHVPFVRIINK